MHGAENVDSLSAMVAMAVSEPVLAVDSFLQVADWSPNVGTAFAVMGLCTWTRTHTAF